MVSNEEYEKLVLRKIRGTSVEKVIMCDIIDNDPNIRGEYNSYNNVVKIVFNEDIEQFEKTLLHEIGHSLSTNENTEQLLHCKSKNRDGMEFIDEIFADVFAMETFGKEFKVTRQLIDKVSRKARMLIIDNYNGKLEKFYEIARFMRREVD